MRELDTIRARTYEGTLSDGAARADAGEIGAPPTLPDLFLPPNGAIHWHPPNSRKVLRKIGAPPTLPDFFLTLSYQITYHCIRPGEPRPHHIFLSKYMRFFASKTHYSLEAFMPRKNRFAPPGYWLHITQRGNDRQRVFLSDADRQYFLDLLAARSAPCASPPGVHVESLPFGRHRRPSRRHFALYDGLERPLHHLSQRRPCLSLLPQALGRPGSHRPANRRPPANFDHPSPSPPASFNRRNV